MARSALPLSMHVMCMPSDHSAAFLAGAIPLPPLPNMRQQSLQRRLGALSLHAKALLDCLALLPHLLSPSRSLLHTSLPLSFGTATRWRSWNSLPLWLLSRSRPLSPLPPPLGPGSGPPVPRAPRVVRRPLQRLLLRLRPRPDKTLSITC